MTTMLPTRIFIACPMAWLSLGIVLVASASAEPPNRATHKLYPTDLPTGARLDNWHC